MNEKPEQRLIGELKELGIENPLVLKVFETLTPESFSALRLKNALEGFAYKNHPLAAKLNEAVSHPFVVALSLQLMEVSPQMKILEIGTGAGYQAAALSLMGCRVYSLERIYFLYLEARKKMKELNLNPRLYYTDGSRGLKDKAPFDRIISSAAFPSFPGHLEDQLNQENGILICPVGNDFEPQRLWKVKYAEGRRYEEKLIYSSFAGVEEGTFAFGAEAEQNDGFMI